MTTNEIIELMLETARRQATESDNKHPEDLACTMINAIESSSTTLTILWEKSRA